MANVLYLVHRLPFPPNKGDKVRSFHLLQHLAARADGAHEPQGRQLGRDGAGGERRVVDELVR